VNGAGLVGVWMSGSMQAAAAGVYDVLVFRHAGTGFHDHYDATHHHTERFRWSMPAEGSVTLESFRLQEFDPVHGGFTEQPATLQTTVAFTIADETRADPGPVRSLRFVPGIWPGAADCYLLDRRDLPVVATFAAERFRRGDNPAESTFKGRDLSDFLARRLESRQIPVDERTRDYFSSSYHRAIEIEGVRLGLAVNWDRDRARWQLRIVRPQLGAADEIRTLQHTLDEILRGDPEIRDLVWQTEDEWFGDPPDEPATA